MKVNSPDYRGVGNDEALDDFLKRIAHYEDQYETMCERTENHYSFMKIFNTGEIQIFYNFFLITIEFL